MFLDKIWFWLQPAMPILLALIGLVLFDVLLGVAVAIQQKRFDWQRIADFYVTMVLPLVIGWIGLMILAKMASEAVLGPVYGALVGDGVTWLAWLAVVASIGDSIVSNAKSLWGTLPFNTGGNK